MKKFSFSLDKVLKHRRMQAELAQKDFLEAQRNYDFEDDQLQQMIATKEAAKQQRVDVVQQTQSWSATVEQINQYLTGQDVRIQKQNESLLELKKVVEAKRQILQEALTAAKIIEKLRETKKAEFFQEVAKAEQKETDEMSVMRFAKTEKM
ncbi:MAG: flagellar export protein FliJ [Bdellovibrio sp.]|nr:flagellar export protein FliJ [Bdellovibrio sp.]